MADVAKSFKMSSFTISDNPLNIKKMSKDIFKKPLLLNINTNRIYWHAGGGKDNDNTFDRYKYERKKIGKVAYDIDEVVKKQIKRIWQKQLEKL